ncbi:hypothetical protein PR003_g27993 [Phytophthora rubi]|uniref:RxLR effector protein n=1 Tax=Phytophthora rubi TaxID=129364 RepID=A0A6A3HP73_9STRA|nr:hypothetical protein PR001_g26798 [Phytophthora rubi]KAE9280314.1 hypothetical protein PR003_g27993 [Phytophthora rubi]
MWPTLVWVLLLLVLGLVLVLGLGPWTGTGSGKSSSNTNVKLGICPICVLYMHCVCTSNITKVNNSLQITHWVTKAHHNQQ